jgi:hypothetical protein
VCTLQTSFKDANDWYRTRNVHASEGDWLRPKDAFIASPLSKSQTIAIAICPEYNAVATASDIDDLKTQLEYKQQCFDPLPPSFILNNVVTDFECKVKRPVSFTFSNCGTRLILLTGNV